MLIDRYRASSGGAQCAGGNELTKDAQTEGRCRKLITDRAQRDVRSVSVVWGRDGVIGWAACG